MTADQSSSLNKHCTCDFPAAEQAGLQLEGSRAVPRQGDAATHDAANGHVAHLGQVRAHPIALLLLLLASYIICAIKIKSQSRTCAHAWGHEWDAFCVKPAAGSSSRTCRSTPRCTFNLVVPLDKLPKPPQVH